MACSSCGTSIDVINQVHPIDEKMKNADKDGKVEFANGVILKVNLPKI